MSTNMAIICLRESFSLDDIIVWKCLLDDSVGAWPIVPLHKVIERCGGSLHP